MPTTGITPQIVMLYGRPGVGKLTVAEYLTAETGYNLLHNHSVVDLATSLFPFGTPPFVALRENVWHLAIETALKARSAGIIMTFAPEKTVTDKFIPSLQKRVSAGGGVLHFIELRCAPQELVNRLGSEPRQRFGKLRDVETYQKLDAAGAFDRPVMPEPELVVDTTDQIPLLSARAIAKYLRPPKKSLPG
ncbi:MAG TPA: AAA family ATPase [Gemmatimonadaceae bacterium]|nr:AAA family ATPase [Gemmatimonadaceae bacterium]